MFKIIASLSSIAALRFFGLFVVLPMLSIYALNLSEKSGENAPNMALVGLAISAYALSQIIFQIPFGILGSRYSKRHIIAIGLLVFAIGSVICALASSVEMLILGRVIQGAGAIGSVVSAKITDLVREEERGGAMAMMGVAIFLSFILAMVVGPSLGAALGVDFLFWLTAFLALGAVFLLYFFVPKAPHLQIERSRGAFARLFCNKNVMILNASVLVQKFLMTFVFAVVPVLLVAQLGAEKGDLWQVFALSALAGFVALPVAMVVAEKRKKPKPVLILAIGLFAAAFGAFGSFGSFGAADFGAAPSRAVFTLGVVAFFMGFCIHEPILQNLASKYPKMQDKSLSLGVFTTCGYLGSFLGGVAGGAALSSFEGAAWVLCAAMAAWAALIFWLDNPAFLQNLYLHLEEFGTSGRGAARDFPPQNLQKINEISGVVECYVNKSENVLVVKFDAKITTKEALNAAIAANLAANLGAELNAKAGANLAENLAENRAPNQAPNPANPTANPSPQIHAKNGKSPVNPND